MAPASGRYVSRCGVLKVAGFWRGLLLAFLVASDARAQGTTVPPAGTAGSQPAQNPPVFGVTVIATAPLPGVGLPLQQIPAPVQTATDRDIENSGALDLSAFLNAHLTSVHVNEMQSNPFQPDVNYRGYTASPVLGTPQGLSVYMDGVRLNQPFGEVVSWDLIPRLAIVSTTLMPGSNPLFGLNTLGGALAIQTKDGRSARGTTVQATLGSDVRRLVEFEHGGSRDRSGLDWYVAGSLFGENGWRDDSPSDVRQLFGKLGWRRENTDVALSAAYADNRLTGNALQEQRFLDRDRSSVYTKPDTTDNRSTLLTFSARRSISHRASLFGNAYYRHIRTNILNGDINENSLDQAIYQPGAVERAALAAAGYTGFPLSGADATNTPFPSWRCIAHALLGDQPLEQCNGLINRTHSVQHSAGLAGQYVRRDPVGRHGNQFTMGAAVDRSSVSFLQSTELGYLNPDRSVTGVGAFGDGVTGGTVDGEPYDTRVDLDGAIRTWSLYGTDTLSLGDRWHMTLSGRYNRTTIHNSDRVDPGGGPGSLDGRHVFGRLNPAAGLTFTPATVLTIYGGYSEGSRAPTSVELGCADPDAPCKLPNAMAGDPPLNQVVARTWEAGARGTFRGMGWNAGAFRATNRDDILFVTSDQTGFGYFRNFGETRRQGLELSASAQMQHIQIGVSYTFLAATYQSEETVNGQGNSSNDAARQGRKGLEGTMTIAPGDRIPLTPQHMLKAFADVPITKRLGLDLDLVAVTGSFARGNENNRHEPDGSYYLGPGATAGYGVVNLGARYQLQPWMQLVSQINNLFNRDYVTAAQLGSTGFTDSGSFVARPLPAINGAFPVRHATFFAPGAPIRIWAGTRIRF